MRVRPRLPLQFQDEYTARYALDSFVWDRRVPAVIRRKYLTSHVAAAFASACLSGALLAHGQVIGSAIFACFFAFAMWRTGAKWLKHRDEFG
jgi:hypothetical protein